MSKTNKFNQCTHDLQLYGELSGRAIHLCYHCCALVMHSGLINGYIILEKCPNQKQYCQEQISLIKEAERKILHESKS